MKLLNETKIGLFVTGNYKCEVPGTCHANWTEQDWVNWIDSHGEWGTGGESVDTDTPDPADTITVPRERVERQVRQQFETACRRINSGVATQTAEGWGYWFATTFLCDALGITEAQQKEWGK